MRVLGILLIVVGCIGGCGSLAEDTTVSTRGGDRVHNVGLVAARQTHLTISGFVAIAGVLFFGFGALIDARRAPEGPQCPMCSGVVGGGNPLICKYCRSPLRWLDGRPLTPEQFERLRLDQARRHRRQEILAAESAQASAERRKQALENGRALASVVSRAARASVASAVGAGIGFNRLIETAAGEGNRIVYRFLQLVIYAGVPAAIAVVTIAAIRR